MPAIEHEYIDLNDVKLHVAYAGPRTGKLILFLHGFPENWLEWRKQILFFSKKGFLAVAIDQRGYNLSSKPNYSYNYRIDILATDVIRVAKHFGHKKFYLVGHDWGANVAWWTTLRFQKAVEKLVIINVPHPMVMKKILVTFPKQIFRSWYIFFLQIPLLAEFFVSFRKGIFLSYLVTSSARNKAISHKTMSYYRASWTYKNVQSMINWYRGMKFGSDPSLPRLPSIKIQPPMLLLWGLKDRFIVKEAIKPSLQLCKNPSCVIFPSSTHWLVHEKPHKVSSYIFDFVTK